MSNKRIRYTSTNKPHVKRSVRTFENNRGARFQVKIDTEKLTYWIVNIRSQLIVRSTEKDGLKPPKNMYTVYEQVKRALKSLRIEFEHEFRGLDNE